jgi:cytochrome c oxidase assembly protein subunit 15
MGVHAAIEFGNRMVTIVVVAVAVVTWLVVMSHRPRRTDLRRLATFALLGVPLQAAVGGISVLTGLNPWIVSTHFLISLVMVSRTATLARRAGPSAESHLPPAVRALAALCLIAAWLVFLLGTMVTGAGPHAGDPGSGRNGFDETAISQLHADAVCVLFGATVALVVVAWSTKTTRTVRRLAVLMLATELAQGAVGFTQNRTGLPWGLVLVHLALAAALAGLVTVLFDH